MTAKSALVLIAHGTEDIEVTSVVDILRRGGVMVTLLRVPEPGIADVKDASVTCANGVHIVADKHWTSMNATQRQAFDILVVPGGGQGVQTFCVVITCSGNYLGMNLPFLCRMNM